jgi:MFS family permease
LLALAGVLLLDAFSYSLILPLLPFILKSYQAGAVMGGLLIAIHALFAAVSGPLLGALSDRIGRRSVILASIFGTAVSYLVFAFSRDLFSLFLARAISGTMAGNAGVVQAAAADRTAAEVRAKAMGLLSAAMAMGFVLGPVIGALIGQIAPGSNFWPGIAACVGSVVAFSTTWLKYREAPGAAAGSLRPKGARPLKQLDYRTIELLGLIAAAAFAQTGLVSMTGFWANHAFGWGSAEVSLLFFWVSLFMVASQVVAVPRLASVYGERSSLIVALALCVAAVAGLIIGARSSIALLACAPLLFCGITIIQTMSASLLSQGVEAGERGALLGLSNGVGAVARVIGPALCGLVFQHVDASGPYWLVGSAMSGWLIWLGFRGRGAAARQV